MARVIWTPEALRNLDTIGDYMLQVAPESAAPLLARLIEALEPVSRFPKLGRMVPEFEREDIREIVTENYRIVYAIDGDTVWVTSVLHAAMDVEARLRHLGERP